MAVLVGRPVRGAAGAKEEGSQIPAVAEVEAELLVSLLAVGNDLVEAGGIGDDGLVVVHEVGVVRGHGVGVDLTVDGGSLDGTGIVVLGDELGSLGAQLGQSASLDKAGKLVVSEAEQVAAGVHVGDHLGGSIALAHVLDGGLDHDAVGVLGVEIVDLLLHQLNDVLRAPDLDLIGTGKLTAGAGIVGLGFGGLAALGVSLRVVGLVGAGSERKDHHNREQQCDNSFEFHWFILLEWMICSGGPEQFGCGGYPPAIGAIILLFFRVVHL